MEKYLYKIIGGYIDVSCRAEPPIVQPPPHIFGDLFLGRGTIASSNGSPDDFRDTTTVVVSTSPGMFLHALRRCSRQSERMPVFCLLMGASEAYSTSQLNYCQKINYLTCQPFSFSALYIFSSITKLTSVSVKVAK